MIKEKLQEALDSKKNDIASFIWKGPKKRVGNSFVQDEIVLVKATPTQIQEFYNYCKTMLNNTSKDNPGRYNVLSTIKVQRLKCNIELFLRNLENNEDNKIPRHKLNELIQEFLRQNPSLNRNDLTMGQVANVSSEYSNLPLSMVIDGCLDQLGVFNKKHLTLAFILKQGLWLTKLESQDLIEYDDNGDLKNKIDVVKERLAINKNIELRTTPKGLSFSKLRAMLQLKNKKYSEMTAEQLITLRTKILFNLESEVEYHINQWEERAKQLEKVAEFRNIEI